MKIYVVGSPAGFGGKESLLLDRFGAAECEFVYVDGRSVRAADFFSYQRRYYCNSGSLLAPGEFGCLRSHMAIYEKIVKSRCRAVVVEDDVLLRPWFRSEYFKRIEEAMPHDGVCIMGGQDGLLTSKEYSVLGFYLLPKGHVVWRTVGYYIGPEAAEKILCLQKESTRRADDWSQFSHSLNIPIYYCDLLGHPVEANPEMESERRNNIYVESVLVRCARKIDSLFSIQGKVSRPKMLFELS